MKAVEDGATAGLDQQNECSSLMLVPSSPVFLVHPYKKCQLYTHIQYLYLLMVKGCTASTSVSSFFKISTLLDHVKIESLKHQCL